MKNLETFTLNPFSDPKISLTLKKKFGEDSIQRIATQNTDNRFDELLNRTVDRQTDLFGAITSVDTTAAIQKARTQSVDNLIERFKTRTSRLNAYLIANGVQELPVYQEFFPQGVTAFTRDTNKGNVEQRMTALVNAIKDHTALSGGAAVLAEYQAFLADYKTARDGQLGKISQLSGHRESRHSAEAEWDDQMFDNLLTFARLHRGQPDKLILYMNQSILRSRQSTDTDGRGQVTGVVTGGTGNQPLGGVTVHVVDGNINDATTGPDGSYRLQSLPVGDYEIVYSKTGYTTARMTTTVADEGDTTQNLSLEAL